MINGLNVIWLMGTLSYNSKLPKNGSGLAQSTATS